MQFSTVFLASLVAVGALAGNPRLTERAEEKSLPGLNPTQNKNAQAILGEIKKSGLGKNAARGCAAVFATALQESEIYIYANKAVPESLKLPHDKIGDNLDSVGIFQQRPTYYPNVKADMDPAESAGQFIKVMKGIANWPSIETSQLCQDVQHAAAGNLYGQHVAQAQQICKAGGIS